MLHVEPSHCCIGLVLYGYGRAQKRRLLSSCKRNNTLPAFYMRLHSTYRE